MGSYLDKTASLTPVARRIICEKATEYPLSGAYNGLLTQGTYLCRRCGLALFRANSQFSAGCGWPSFDAEIENTVKHQPDRDGQRTEILCNRCLGHLGHIFSGEYLTTKNLRYCVNSASIDFVVNNSVLDTEEAIVAGGCFWGIDHFLRQLPGVLNVEVGYCGGIIENPTYEQVCQINTGHYEAARVIYDISKINYHAVIKRFFEIHDPTQHAGQGPDIGPQYQSAVFYFDSAQATEVESLLQRLRSNGYEPATRLVAAQPFWPAEDYHQNYYAKHHKTPYCHTPVLRFSSP